MSSRRYSNPLYMCIASLLSFCRSNSLGPIWQAFRIKRIRHAAYPRGRLGRGIILGLQPNQHDWVSLNCSGISVWPFPFPCGNCRYAAGWGGIFPAGGRFRVARDQSKGTELDMRRFVCNLSQIEGNSTGYVVFKQIFNTLQNFIVFFDRATGC